MVLETGTWEGDKGWASLAWFPIPAVLALFVLFSLRGPEGGMESPWLLLLGNFVFGTATSVLVIYLVAGSFLNRGRLSLLSLGCGVMFWGAAGLVGAAAALRAPDGFDVNTTVTIFACCVWLSSLCHLAGAAMPQGWTIREPARMLWQTAALTVCLLIIGALVYSALAGNIPLFFADGFGGTAVRRWVLVSSGVMFVLTTGLLWTGRPVSKFLYWYGLALLLLAASLFGLLFIREVWDWFAWTCRASQAIAACYMLVAALQAIRGRNDKYFWLSVSMSEARYRYGVAISAVIAAAVMRMVFLPETPLRFTFNVFYPAVALAALYGGFGPGLLVTVLSVPLAAYYSMIPDGESGVTMPSNLLVTFLFVATNVLVSWLSETVHRTLHRTRQAEAQLREHRDRLEEMVRERTAELTLEVEKYQRAQAALIQAKAESERARAEAERARADAEYANEAKSRFMAAASHDLRQPLGALSLYVGALEARPTKADETLIRNMQKCVTNLGEMLNNLLDLSKLEAGVVTTELDDFPLDRVFGEITAGHQPRSELKGLSLRCRTTGLVAHTDAVLFGRIVANLVSNAIRYTERGGVLVGVRRFRGKRWVEVWDTGVGIPEDKIGQIFEEFRQLGNSERNREKGSGLGLAIVARTATLLGLEVRVRSTPGKGSMFAIELPPARKTGPLAWRGAGNRSLRVALIEDDATMRQALTYALLGHGHQVIAGGCGEEIRAGLGGKAPDVVVSDYGLPGGETGIDVVRSLRREFGCPLPSVIITGNTDPILLREAMAHGIQVRHKPIGAEVLQSCIEDLVNKNASDARDGTPTSVA